MPTVAALNRLSVTRGTYMYPARHPLCMLLSAFCIVAMSAMADIATIGIATSMETIRPRAGYAVRPAQEARIRLARGEYESFQILVAPDHDLKGVKVAVEGDLSPMQNAQCSMRNGTGATSDTHPSNRQTVKPRLVGAPRPVRTRRAGRSDAIRHRVLDRSRRSLPLARRDGRPHRGSRRQVAVRTSPAHPQARRGRSRAARCHLRLAEHPRQIEAAPSRGRPLGRPLSSGVRKGASFAHPGTQFVVEALEDAMAHADAVENGLVRRGNAVVGGIDGGWRTGAVSETGHEADRACDACGEACAVKVRRVAGCGLAVLRLLRLDDLGPAAFALLDA